MEEYEWKWSLAYLVKPDGTKLYQVFAPFGDEENVASFDHYPSEEEVVAAISMWKVNNG